MNITIIGSGNIGSALVTGLLRSDVIAPYDITLSDISHVAMLPFEKKGVRTTCDNAEAVKDADMVILCIKPYLVESVMKEILPEMTENTIIISFAAGIPLDRLQFETGKRPLFRAIPNTAMAVCQSMTCIATSDDTDDSYRSTVMDFFDLVGKTMMIDESLMNAATVVASCGTAFALRYLRAAMEAGIEIGFRPDVACKMIAQTMLGAATMIMDHDSHPEEEIDKVTTPKGITIKGLNEMEHVGFSSAVMQGILEAYEVMNS